MIKRANGRLVYYFWVMCSYIIKKTNIIKKMIIIILLKIQNYYYYYLDNYFLNKIRILILLLCNIFRVKDAVVLEAGSPYFSLLFLIVCANACNDQDLNWDNTSNDITGEELTKKFNGINFDFYSFKKKNPPLGSPNFEFKFEKEYLSISREGTRWIYPERYHIDMYDAKCSNSNSLREYLEGGIKYTYHAESREIENRYCIITYPDGTTLRTNKAEAVFNHIRLNRKLIHLNKYSINSTFYYAHDYVEYFSSFKRISVNSLLNSENIVNREKITINELLNRVEVEQVEE